MYVLEESYTLNDDQLKVSQSVLDAIDAGYRKIIIKGSAGVGKTYMVDYLVKKYRRDLGYGMIYITAPTNRAVAVLLEKNKKVEFYMEYTTIHKALFLKRQINNKTGEITFKPDYNPKKQRPFNKGCIIVVDEASMLNSELLIDLESSEYKDIPMIFLGDNKQLNPVNEPDSPIFHRVEMSGQTIKVKQGDNVIDHIIPSYVEFELTKIVRQSEGNPIIELSRNLINVNEGRPKLIPDKDNPDFTMGYEYTSDYQKCIDIITTEPNTIYLSWTNADVDKTNGIARNKLFITPNKLEIGETIIFDAPYKGFYNDYYTNYVLTVKTLAVKSKLFSVTGKFTGQDPNSGKPIDIDPIQVDLMYYLVNDDIMIIHETSQNLFLTTYRRLKELTKIGLGWRTVYAFAETFAMFSYSYASTVHKAQGGTYHTVIINKKVLDFNRTKNEHQRLWYTAITRAAKKVIIYNPPLYEGSI